MINRNENLISIDEVVARARQLGVNFGKGDPRNRLRYYTKIGLLSHAKRKSFNGAPPNGAYPAEAIGILVEIDRQIKAGGSIQAIKREIREKKEGKEEILFETSSTPTPIHIYNRPYPLPSDIEEEFPVKKAKPFFKLPALSKLLFIFLVSGTITFFVKAKIDIEDLPPVFLAAVSRFGKLAQSPSPLPPPAEKEILALSSIEPYLTINAETVINSSLNVKEVVSSPVFDITKGEFKVSLIADALTADRTYTFPDSSGTVCLAAGNCVGLGGEVISSGGISNRLAKFITPQEIGVSSIEDLYSDVALTIDSDGQIGIGTKNPRYSLHVVGRIQASGDICTNLAGGRCLSTLPLGGAPSGGGTTIITGVGGSGTASYLPIWTTGTNLGDSIIYQSGSNIGIGTSTTPATLTLSGNAVFATTTLPQLALQYDGSNYLRFSIDGDQSEIFASKTMVLNSLTGQIQLGNDVNLLNATSAAVWGQTFASAANDATVRKSGELILRSNVPVFKFPVPAQTTSTAAVAVTKQIATSTLNAALPSSLAGTTRYFAFLLNFADNIPTSASSTWTIDLESGSDTTLYFSGQATTELEEGVAHMSKTFLPPSENWQLKVNVPSGRTIRIFNIFLLVFDRVN